MELYQEMLLKLLSEQELQVTFPGLQSDLETLLESRCYQALRAIRDVLHDDSLDDVQCFARIEQIICLFEALGSGGGSRHDFG